MNTLDIDSLKKKLSIFKKKKYWLDLFNYCTLPNLTLHVYICKYF